MIQTTLCVPLEVQPESAARLSALIEEFKQAEDKPHPEAENFARLIKGLPALHFMSLSVFEDTSYDPIFIIEANFDGPATPFWAALEDLVGDTLRDMLRCCKAPLDNDEALYRTVTAEGSRAPVAAYLEARTQAPSVFHHGNRGLTRDRILKEAKLFRAIREELDKPENQGPEPYRGHKPQAFREALRERMATAHPWLNEEAAERVPTQQRLGDFWRLLLFMTQVLFVLTLPGIIAAALLPTPIYVGGILVLAAAAIVFIAVLRKPLPNTDVKTDFNLVGFLVKNLKTIALVVVPPLIVLVA
ncbi:MAG: hypothetical protein AAF697_14815, partial [Pseudomonadota bacterium]